jgi:hypothetical protein
VLVERDAINAQDGLGGDTCTGILPGDTFLVADT